MERVTKIVATIGPACQDIPTLTELLLAGVNVTRLNFSHGTQENHAQVLHNLRDLSVKLNHPICVLQDLQGPKIRVGEIENGAVELLAGASISITTRAVIGNSRLISVEFPELPNCVKPGGRILLDDGNLELQVVAVQDELIHCKVITGGILKPKKGLNLPGVSLPVSALTEKDKEDLAFGLAHGVDMVALSFVRTVEDIDYCRQIMRKLAPEKTPIPIIAKLERPEALQNLDAIVCAADGVMVARGDLGVEMSPEEVPIAQKRIIESANLHGRVVITATQMLDSMVNNPRPTRAEASDVANAIFDGTDAVMLSGETATGKFPVKSVQTMSAIIRQAEAHMAKWGNWQGIHEPDYATDDAYYVAQAAKALADDSNVAAVAVFSHSGRTARVMSKIRPSVPILGFTSSQLTFNQMQLYWGVVSHLVPHANTIEEMLAFVDQALIKSTIILPGQQVVLVCGYPLNAGRPPNLALLHTVGE